MSTEQRRAAEIRATIAAMQPEIGRDERCTGSALRAWQDEAVQIYLECYQAARAGVQSPYTQGRLRAWERTA